MNLSRRRFLGALGAVTLGFEGLRTFLERGTIAHAGEPGYGPLVSDPEGILDLPRGFHYTAISPFGQRMDDGFVVPDLHDGMAAFPGPRGTVLLVRNHEVVVPSHRGHGPFGDDLHLLPHLDRSRLYDPGIPCEGGTTTLVYDPAGRKVVHQYLSLIGTHNNCAGGVSFGGTGWITCEEDSQTARDGFERDHGYNFLVPARAEGGPVEPVPLKAMGRFDHEAVAVDPRTGIHYQTEDQRDGLFTRFLPEDPRDVARGGRLQALAIPRKPGVDTSNSPSPVLVPGQGWDVRWVDLTEVEAPNGDLRQRGREAGAAIFNRGEGAAYGEGSIYFCCTEGGLNRRGQVWRYEPSPYEGTPKEKDEPGRLVLFVEPNDDKKLDYADNVAFSPWGDLVVCEDGAEDQYLVGITPGGSLYHLARNARDTSEFAGATFSPDGSILFVNIQRPGVTLAITGPWRG